MIHDKVVAEGNASSGKSARAKACLNASAALRDVDLDEYRKRFHCDCSPGTGTDRDHHIPLAKEEDKDEEDDDDDDDDDEVEQEEKPAANAIEEDILVDSDLNIVPSQQDHHHPKGGVGNPTDEELIMMGEEVSKPKCHEGRKEEKKEEPNVETGVIIDEPKVKSAPPNQSMMMMVQPVDEKDDLISFD